MLVLTTVSQAQKLNFETMSDAEKTATGVEKLSDSEKTALLKWIHQERLTQDVAERKKNMGLNNNRSRDIDESQVKARLTKQYSNQLGDTFYQLGNGQIWKQVSTGHIYLEDDGPGLVTIEPGFMGSWTLSGDGNRSVKVKRIK